MPSSDFLAAAPKPRQDKTLTDEDCNDPVDVPDRDLGWKETAKLWGQDRASLVDCKARNRANRKSTKVVSR